MQTVAAIQCSPALIWSVVGRSPAPSRLGLGGGAVGGAVGGTGEGLWTALSVRLAATLLFPFALQLRSV